jgi:LPPG:FO 2-phospho-L-lactate transferase
MQGLYHLKDRHELSAIVNVGDDIELLGLRISPDIDTVVYALAGLVDEKRGWGLRGDTFNFMEMMKKLGSTPYLALGDMDLATHVYRSHDLKQGNTLDQVTRNIARRLGVEIEVMPVTNDRLITMVTLGREDISFEEYFIKSRPYREPERVFFIGSSTARPLPMAIERIRDSDLVIFAPSNPVASLMPILALKDVYVELARTAAYRIAISPIIGGRTVKGPADKMLRGCGFEASVTGVAKIYTGLIDGIVIDKDDISSVDEIKSLGLDCLVTNTVMKDQETKEKLAREVVEFASRMIST